MQSSEDTLDATKTSGEVYRRGLDLGLFTVAEVSPWIDGALMSAATPDYAIIEAALSISKGTHAVAKCLEELPGEADRDAVLRRLLGAMSVYLERDRDRAFTVGRWLWELAWEIEKLNDPDCGAPWGFDDDLSLAADGVIGDVDEVIDEMADFLGQYRE